MYILPTVKSELDDEQRFEREQQIDKIVYQTRTKLSENIEIAELQRYVLYLADVLEQICKKST